jgi:hypothetical protein
VNRPSLVLVWLWVIVRVCLGIVWTWDTLFVANETGVAPGLGAGFMNAGFFMASSAIVHLHPIPAIVLDAGDVMAPNVTAVAGNPVLFIRLETFRCAGVTVAGDTIHFGAFHMRRVGEEDAVRLARIHMPWHFTVFLHVLLDKNGLVLALTDDILMAINALGQSGHAGKGAVFAEKMATLATVIDLFKVQFVIEIEWLTLF